MKKLISILLSIAIISISISILPIYAETSNMTNISSNTDFADDRVLVVMNNQASLKFKNYTINDFKQYGCKYVTDLSTSTSQKVKLTMQNLTDHVLYNTPINNNTGVELDKYNQIICLELKEHGKENVLSLIEELNKRDDVLYAAPDYKLTADTTIPEDELYDMQTYYNNIKLPQAWDITTGSDSVMVGIIDAGIDNSHLDFGNKLNSVLSKDFSVSNGNGNAFSDAGFHGTACASVIAADTDNNMGISGVCWNIQLVSLKIAGENEEPYSSKAIAAINYADSVNIPIISMSLSWSDDIEKDNMYAYHPMDEEIENYSGLFVCSAGNNSNNNDTLPYYPANYSLPNLITVGASTINDQLADYSNFGSTTVDIFAPGSVLAIVPLDWMLTHDSQDCSQDHIGSGYHYLSGTSFSTPMVAGVAALMLSVNPNLSARELKHIIIVEDDNIAALNNRCVSDGRVNAYKAVNHARYHSLNVSYSSTMHSFYCNGCGYTNPKPHEFYIANKLSGSYTINCKDCPYSFTCNHTPQYSGTTDEGHSVVCSNGCYSLFESHNPTYYQTNSLSSHKCTCTNCGYIYFENHNWTDYGAKYRCSKCLKITDAIPDIMIFPLDDDLLLNSSEGDNGVTEALLPEKEDENKYANH